MDSSFIERILKSGQESRAQYLRSELAHAQKDRDDLTRHIDWLRDELAKLQDANQRLAA